MLDPLREATLPVAPVLAGADAAPAVEAMAVTARSAVAPVPARHIKRRRVLLRLVSDCIVVIPLSLLCLCLVVCGVVGTWDYSLRRASMGASVAARLAGYTPKSTPMAGAIMSAQAAAVGLVEMGSPISPGSQMPPARPATTPSTPPIR